MTDMDDHRSPSIKRRLAAILAAVALVVLLNAIQPQVPQQFRVI